jgi:hypothetical protein
MARSPGVSPSKRDRYPATWPTPSRSQNAPIPAAPKPRRLVVRRLPVAVVQHYDAGTLPRCGHTSVSKCSLASRCHHLVKTFWGWHDQQLPDGTVILRSPSGYTHVTTPGSALLFPSLCRPTGELPATQPGPPLAYCGERSAMMPKRRRTRAQNRAHRIATERRQNRNTRAAQRSERMSYFEKAPPQPDDEPPPF